jgi:hypothetical protein
MGDEALYAIDPFKLAEFNLSKESECEGWR